jgi:hypothetical protein
VPSQALVGDGIVLAMHRRMTALLLLPLLATQILSADAERLASGPDPAQRACIARQRAFAPAATDAFVQLKCGATAGPSVQVVPTAGLGDATGDPVDRDEVRVRLFAPRGGRGWIDERQAWSRKVSRAVPITAAVFVSAAIIGLSPLVIPAVWLAGHWIAPAGSGIGPVIAMGGVVALGITQASIGLLAAGAGLFVGQLRGVVALADDEDRPLGRPGTLALAE